MKKLKAKRAFSKGIVIEKAFVVSRTGGEIPKKTVEDTDGEIKRWDAAIKKASDDLSLLAKDNEIFGAHLEMVKDPSLYDQVTGKIKSEHKCAEWALSEVISSLSEIFSSMDDEYMKARGDDVKDIGRRLTSALMGEDENLFDTKGENVIVCAKELTPSDTALMDFSFIKGFITEEGGTTSHVAIISRSLNIPAIVGVDGLLQCVKSGDLIAMDAGEGTVCIDPDGKTLSDYEDKKAEYEKQLLLMAEAINLPSRTADGHDRMICANVGSIEDLKDAVKYNPDGVGLFRTEFFFIQSDHFPTEDEQYAVYKEAAELLGKRELIIRTLDIGGDKGLSYFDFGEEENPFLGYRAIRFCLDRQDVFKTQLKALIRASAHGNIKIMYPMIASMDELDKANSLIEECKEELRKEGKEFNAEVPVGMMIETPASVMLADEFAKKVAFFSIGTNDLTQYILACDRGNSKVAYLYDSFNPAVLRAIKRTIDCGHDAGIPVGMCGEFASDTKAFRLLLGMGLDEFSVSAGAIPELKYLMAHTSYEEAKKL